MKRKHKARNPEQEIADEEPDLLLLSRRENAERDIRRRLVSTTRALLRKHPEYAETIMSVLDGCYAMAHDHREGK